MVRSAVGVVDSQGERTGVVSRGVTLQLLFPREVSDKHSVGRQT